jgi:hypothetical protein
MPASKPGLDYDWIAKALKDGEVVPFLGAGASAGCGLPSGKELAQRLLTEIERKVKFRDRAGRDNLALVASYLAQITDSLRLDSILRETFSIAAEPGELHKCLASINELQLIVTTNYDDLIEQALAARRPWIIVDRGISDIVWLRSLDSAWERVDARELPTEIIRIGTKIIESKLNDINDKIRRGDINGDTAKSLIGELTQTQARYLKAEIPEPIIFKMHGTLDRLNKEGNAFLITEEHYVDFLGRPDKGRIPAMLEAMMQRKNFLFWVTH